MTACDMLRTVCIESPQQQQQLLMIITAARVPGTRALGLRSWQTRGGRAGLTLCSDGVRAHALSLYIVLNKFL